MCNLSEWGGPDGIPRWKRERSVAKGRAMPRTVAVSSRITLNEATGTLLRNSSNDTARSRGSRSARPMSSGIGCNRNPGT